MWLTQPAKSGCARINATLAGLPASFKVHYFDELYENGDSFEAVYAAIVEKVLELGQRPEGVVYAVPGDPFLAEATCPAIAQRAARPACRCK